MRSQSGMLLFLATLRSVNYSGKMGIAFPRCFCDKCLCGQCPIWREATSLKDFCRRDTKSSFKTQAYFPQIV